MAPAARVWVRTLTRFDQPLGGLSLATLLNAGVSILLLCANVLCWTPSFTSLSEPGMMKNCVVCDSVDRRCLFRDYKQLFGDACSVFRVDTSSMWVRYVHPFTQSLCLTAGAKGEGRALVLAPCLEARQFKVDAEGHLELKSELDAWHLRQGPSRGVDPVCVLQVVYAALTAAFVLRLKRKAFTPANELDKVEVEVTSLSGRSCTLCMDTSQLVQDVKEEVERQWQIPGQRQCLLMGEEELPNSAPLKPESGGRLVLTLVVLSDPVRPRICDTRSSANIGKEVQARVQHILSNCQARICSAAVLLTAWMVCLFSVASRCQRLLRAALLWLLGLHLGSWWLPLPTYCLGGFAVFMPALCEIHESAPDCSREWQVMTVSQIHLILAGGSVYCQLAGFYEVGGLRYRWWNEEVAAAELLFLATGLLARALHSPEQDWLLEGVNCAPLKAAVAARNAHLRGPAYQRAAQDAPATRDDEGAVNAEVLGRPQA